MAIDRPELKTVVISPEGNDVAQDRARTVDLEAGTVDATKAPARADRERGRRGATVPLHATVKPIPGVSRVDPTRPRSLGAILGDRFRPTAAHGPVWILGRATVKRFPNATTQTNDP